MKAIDPAAANLVRQLRQLRDWCSCSDVPGFDRALASSIANVAANYVELAERRATNAGSHVGASSGWFGGPSVIEIVSSPDYVPCRHDPPPVFVGDELPDVPRRDVENGGTHGAK